MFQVSGNGFTLIEVLLSAALIALVAGISAPVYQSFQIKNDLDIAQNTIGQTLRRAQILSQSVDGDVPWGVKIQTGSVVLFKGASYAVRDAGFNEIFDVPSNIIPSGLTEIIFAKFSGLPPAAGTVTLTAAQINETRTIAINEKGTILY